MKTLVEILSRSKIVFFILCFASCGVEIGNPKKPKNETNSLVVNDTDLSTEIVSSQMDEIISGIHMGSGAVEANLVDGASIDKSCASADATSVQVNHKISAPFSKTRTISRIQFQLYQDGSLTREMNWSRGQGGLACNTSQSGVKLSNANLDGAKLTSKSTRKLSRTFSVVRTGRVVRKTEINASLNVTHQFSEVSSASNVLTFTRTSTWSGTKSFVQTKATGEQVSISGDVEVSAKNPMVVTTTLDSTASLKWKTHTIKSGVIRKIAVDGSVLDLTLTNLKYESASSCRPVSGTISGATYSSKDSTDALSTFTVDFTSDDSESALIYVTFQNGDKKSFSANGCDFDEE